MKETLTVLLMALIVTGCAMQRVKEMTGFEVKHAAVTEWKQPWQGGSLCCDPRKEATIPTYPIDVSENSWLVQEVYCTDEGFFPIETWGSLSFVGDKTYETCSVLNDDGNRVFALYPGYDEEEVWNGQVVVISAFGDAVMTLSGEVVPMKQEDIERLKTERVFRDSFFREHPSPITPKRVIPFNREFPEGKTFIDELVKRFPDVRMKDGHYFSLSDKGLKLRALSPDKEFADRFITHRRLALSAQTFFCPYCAGAAIGIGVARTLYEDPHKSCVKRFVEHLEEMVRDKQTKEDGGGIHDQSGDMDTRIP